MLKMCLVIINILITMKIRDIYREDRPREKLIKKGASALRDEELLAILLRTGVKGKGVVQVAKDIKTKCLKKGLASASFEELKNIYGVGPTKAVNILAGIELGRRVFRKDDTKDIYITTARDIFNELQDIKDSRKEHFIAFYLDARRRVIKREIISVGIINAAIVHPREVFEPAIKNLAVAIIVAHNHPSGDPSPSDDDLALHKRMCKAGSILGISVLDHVIVTAEKYISFKEEGCL